MNRFLVLLAGAAAVLAGGNVALADSVTLNMDTAPNGGAAFNAWRTNAFSDAANGTFVNMANGDFAGSTRFSADEAIVHSTLGGGQRLHWIYWVPGETIASLSGRFQVRDVADWDGVDYTYDWGTGGLVEATDDNGWIQPGSWIDYDANGDSTIDGVIGTFGNAWWAYDDLAPEYSTDGNPYNETDEADIAEMIRQVNEYQTFWRGEVRIKGDDGTWQVHHLTGTVAVVPTPGAAAGGLALIGLTALRRRRAA